MNKRLKLFRSVLSFVCFLSSAAIADVEISDLVTPRINACSGGSMISIFNPVYSQSTPAPQAWVLPERDSNVMYQRYNEATNTSGWVVDSSVLGLNTGKCIVAQIYPYWQSSSNGMSANYLMAGGASISNRYGGWDSGNLSKMSLQMWYRLIPSGDGQTFICKFRYVGGVGDSSFSWDANNTSIMRLWIPTTTNDVSGTSVSANQAMTPNVWTLYTAVYDAGSINIYFNTNRVACTTNGAIPSSIIWTPEALSMGWLTGLGYPMQGNFDDPAMWTNKAITIADIQNVFTNTYQTHGWSNSLALSNPSLYSNTVLEILGEYNYPADTSYIGTNHLNSYSGANAYDPAWRANGTNGWWQFDGVNDYLAGTACGFNDGTNFTATAWLFPEAPIGAYEFAIGKRDGTGLSGLHVTSSGSGCGLVWWISDNNSRGTTVTAPVLTNAWNMVAVSRVGVDCNFYVNGILVTTVTNGFAGYGVSTAGSTWNIGREPGGNYYSGKADEVRLSANNYSLTSNQIFSIFNTSKQAHTNSTPW